MRIGLAGAGRIGVQHATTLCAMEGVDAVVVADVLPSRAQDVAARLGAEAAVDLDALFASGLDGLVVTASTDVHAELLVRGVRAGLTVFCEKPVAADVEGTRAVVNAIGADNPRVQVGFQRRFDVGFAAARQAVLDGVLGWVHTVRASTLDAAPPPADYVGRSGGIFRDCSIHDFDAVRWVTGREPVRVFAAGANRGDDVFREAGDVDTATALLVLDDDTLVTVAGTRYNAAGYDVRMEVLGSEHGVCVGSDARTPLRSLEPGAAEAVTSPYLGFLDRFASAYVAELHAFTSVVAGLASSACTVDDALQSLYVAEACDLSRREARPVEMREVQR